MMVARKKHLRAPAAIRKHPFTGGAEALTGRQTGLRFTDRDAVGGHTTETDEAGCAQGLSVTCLLSSPLFDMTGI